MIEVFTGCDLITGERLGAWRWAGLLFMSELRHARHVDDVVVALRLGADDVGRAAQKRILVVGENSFEYSRSLRQHLGDDYDIIATSYETQMQLAKRGFVVPESQPGLRIITEVDARRLGDYTDDLGDPFDYIIFNNPQTRTKTVHPQAATGQLIDDVLNSAPTVLKPGGEVRFGMGNLENHYTPGTPRMRDIVKQARNSLNTHFAAQAGATYRVEVQPYTSDIFGVPYQPRKTSGVPLFSVEEMNWYRFILIP